MDGARRGVLTIAVATGMASMSMYLWFPFLPLFLQQVGARNDAEAAFWMALALTGQGIGRLLSGPLWGIVSDRVGRKKMFVRALFSAGIVNLLASAITAPWQLIIAMTLIGLLAGFNPAAIALASVSVPDARMKATLGMVSGGQYVGLAVGPAVGAGLALTIGYRGTGAVSGLAIIAVAMLVVWLVPSDMIKAGGAEAAGAASAEGNAGRAAVLEPFRLTIQLALAILVYFMLLSLNNFRAVSTAIALKQIEADNVVANTGIAFALMGLASALGVLLMTTRFFRKQRSRTVLVAATLFSAGAYFLQALSGTASLFVVALTLAAFLNAAMFPATNTLIALNVARSRRGTAFGLASGAQAAGLMAGSLAAALFAATSLQIGFAAIAAILACLAVLIAWLVREPEHESQSSR